VGPGLAFRIGNNPPAPASALPRSPFRANFRIADNPVAISSNRVANWINSTESALIRTSRDLNKARPPYAHASSGG
jgi:hypothetical protein